MRTLLSLLLLLFCTSGNVLAVTDSFPGRTLFTLLFTNNLQGEYLPCG